MPRTSKKPLETYTSPWDVTTTVNECKYLVKWNPKLAIGMMNHIAGRITSDIKYTEWYNAALKINKYLDDIEHMPWYSQLDFWGQHTKPERIEVI